MEESDTEELSELDGDDGIEFNDAILYDIVNDPEFSDDDEFLFLSDVVQQHVYDEFNWDQNDDQANFDIPQEEHIYVQQQQSEEQTNCNNLLQTDQASNQQQQDQISFVLLQEGHIHLQQQQNEDQTSCNLHQQDQINDPQTIENILQAAHTQIQCQHEFIQQLQTIIYTQQYNTFYNVSEQLNTNSTPSERNATQNTSTQSSQNSTKSNLPQIETTTTVRALEKGYKLKDKKIDISKILFCCSACQGITISPFENIYGRHSKPITMANVKNYIKKGLCKNMKKEVMNLI